MRLRMLKTASGADDGITLRAYEAGAEYNLPETPRGKDLAQVFLREGWAEQAEPPKVMRLPLLDEYVRAGYPAENYEQFLRSHRERAELDGLRVEIRAMTAAEEAAKAADELAQSEARRMDEERRQAAEATRLEEELQRAAAVPPPPADLPPPVAQPETQPAPPADPRPTKTSRKGR
jgi:hypothetical protein